MKILCAIRDLTSALESYEKEFQAAHGLSLKEGMLLCCVSEQQMAASDIATKIDLSNSNCSKVIRSVEEKGLVQRTFGRTDKRQMLFLLTDHGRECLDKIQLHEVPVPEILKKMFEV